MTDFSSSSPNSFFNYNKNSPTNSNSISPDFRSSNIFSFHTSTDFHCTYNSTNWIFSSTATPLIFILKNNLYAVINPMTLLAFPLNTGGLATSILGLVLDSSAATPPFLTMIACNVAIYPCYILICSNN